MTKQELSEAFFKATDNVHSATTELYDDLHPLGEPQQELNNKVDSILKRFMSSVRVEMEYCREAIREFNNE